MVGTIHVICIERVVGTIEGEVVEIDICLELCDINPACSRSKHDAQHLPCRMNGERAAGPAFVTVDVIPSGRVFSFAALPPHVTVAWLLSEVMRLDAAADAEDDEEVDRGGAGEHAFGVSTVDGAALDMEADAADVILPRERLRAAWPANGAGAEAAGSIPRLAAHAAPSHPAPPARLPVNEHGAHEGGCAHGEHGTSCGVQRHQASSSLRRQLLRILDSVIPVRPRSSQVEVAGCRALGSLCVPPSGAAATAIGQPEGAAGSETARGLHEAVKVDAGATTSAAGMAAAKGAASAHVAGTTAAAVAAASSVGAAAAASTASAPAAARVAHATATAASMVDAAADEADAADAAVAAAFTAAARAANAEVVLVTLPQTPLAASKLAPSTAMAHGLSPIACLPALSLSPPPAPLPTPQPTPPPTPPPTLPGLRQSRPSPGRQQLFRRKSLRDSIVALQHRRRPSLLDLAQHSTLPSHEQQPARRTSLSADSGDLLHLLASAASDSLLPASCTDQQTMAQLSSSMQAAALRNEVCAVSGAAVMAARAALQAAAAAALLASRAANAADNAWRARAAGASSRAARAAGHAAAEADACAARAALCTCGTKRDCAARAAARAALVASRAAAACDGLVELATRAVLRSAGLRIAAHLIQNWVRHCQAKAKLGVLRAARAPRAAAAASVAARVALHAAAAVETLAVRAHECATEALRAKLTAEAYSYFDPDAYC